MSVTSLSTYDPELKPGAKNAIEVCLRVEKDQSIYILTDRKTLSVGRALEDAARNVSSNVVFHILEDHVERPAKALPDSLMLPLESTEICIYCVFPQQGELTSRQQFVRQMRRSRVSWARRC